MQFAKLEALGNDFILIDARGGSAQPDRRRLIELADRRRGIGFDQALLLEDGPGSDDLRVRIFNADGSEAEQCGNGMRAIAAWLDRRGELEPERRLECLAGQVRLTRGAGGRYRAELPGLKSLDPELQALKTPRLDADLDLVGMVSLGNPHLVIRTASRPDRQRLDRIAQRFADVPAWRNRVNIGLARLADQRSIELIVHERGAGPTLACGSGACAAALLLAPEAGPVRVDQPGGSLVIDWRCDRARVATEGPARLVFEGVTR